MKKVTFVYRQRWLFSMISVPCGTGDISSIWYRSASDDICLRHVKERILYHACEASISYGNAVYHIAQAILYVLKWCDPKRKRSNFKIWYNGFTTKTLTKKEDTSHEHFNTYKSRSALLPFSVVICAFLPIVFVILIIYAIF